MVGRYADAWHGHADDAEELGSQMGIIDAAAHAAGRDPSAIVRASSLSISEPWDEVKRSYGWMAAGGIGYLVVSWPGEGRGRVEEFIDQVMPTLG
jgi:alkanesulfonate monooxygenase SsuD/methylene tetrahydromethanopterin reductase-like flavin-dependent oxidoreductase (luciferase family)